jgi:nicotinate-nucleotide pyrophosphorylase (carboxylating)
MNFDANFYAIIDAAFKEDIGEGDHSTLSCFPVETMGKAVLKIKQDCILAGVEVAKKIFQHRHLPTKFTAFKMDGDTVKFGDIAFEVEAPIHTILECERLVLNCMQRMSGIATLTNAYVKELHGLSTKLLDTRKTTPNFRLFEKEAVKIGGGVNHRFGLYDMIMLKDNHIDFSGGLENAINNAWNYVQANKPGLKIEVETRNIEDVKKVISIGKNKVFRVMLDNFSVEQLKEAVVLLKAEGFETEASGGINLENCRAYASTGVDYISVGALIHQAKSVDLSLKAVVKN